MSFFYLIMHAGQLFAQKLIFNLKNYYRKVTCYVHKHKIKQDIIMDAPIPVMTGAGIPLQGVST